MNEIQRARVILKILNKTYPKIAVPLKSRNVFTLLISVLLSAQCTDVNVNNVTKKIYPKTTIKISAQAHLKFFYEEHKFQIDGQPYLEDGIPHVGMVLLER